MTLTLDAARAARESSPAYIRRDLGELERRWARADNDNHRDDLEECAALVARTAPGSPERARVLAVLASVLDEATKAAEANRDVRSYLRGVLDRARWERLVEASLPRARPRSSFAKRRRTSKPKTSTKSPRRRGARKG